MIRWFFRLVALALIAYGIGYAWFAMTLPGAAGDERRTPGRDSERGAASASPDGEGA